MSDPLIEMAEFAGKASGTIVRDLADLSKPLAEAFRRGWRQAMSDEPGTQTASPPSDHTPEPA